MDKSKKKQSSREGEEGCAGNRSRAVVLDKKRVMVYHVDETCLAHLRMAKHDDAK